MSEGSNVQLAWRDLGIEIEKLQEDRDNLRRIIKNYYKADEEYRNEMQIAHDSDEIIEVILRIEWKKAWSELEEEALRDY